MRRTNWTDLKSNLEAGNDVKLVADVAQDGWGAAIDGKTAGLDLNGFTITRDTEAYVRFRPVTLSNGAKLTLTDSSAAKTGAIDGQGVSRNVDGGCVCVGLGCAFTMTGGTITNCVAAAGGGVKVEDGGAFVLSGGTIVGNTASKWGGGVYIASGGTMTFSGGEISCNTANRIDIGGGGICSSGRLTMTGGTIVGNTSTGDAASTAIYSNCDDSDVIFGGIINGTIYREDIADLFIYGGVFDRKQTALASGYTCAQVGSNWIVGEGVLYDVNNKLMGGTYTFCPTNAEYVAAGLAISGVAEVLGNAVEPKT